MKSIRSYLVVMLVAVFSLVSFVAAINGYLSSMREAELLLDKQLAYASDLLRLANRDDRPVYPVTQDEQEIAFQVWRGEQLLISSSSAPTGSIGDFTPGYRFANFAGYRWRTFTSVDQRGDVYIVAERADQRHRVAEKVVLESVLPLLLSLPLAAALVWIVVSWGLKPLRELSRQINARASDALDPVALDRTPSELAQLVASMNALLARLSAAFEREQHFASHAAHELRTPLSVLKVHLHNLAGEVAPGNVALAHANAGVERMHHLVEQLLDLNRTNPEMLRVNFTELNLHALAQRVTADAWPSFEERALTLSLEGDAAMIRGDEALLETLLINLLDNARKYTPAGGEVRVDVLNEHGSAILAVEDSGPGIAAQHRERVFERFYRAAGSRGNDPGSGLGLAIVRHIVQVHEASVELGSSELGGLQVRIVFANQASGR